MAKPQGLPDMELSEPRCSCRHGRRSAVQQRGVHEIHRGIRKVLDEYPDAVAVGEIWVHDNEQFGEYIRPDELHLGFNFRLCGRIRRRRRSAEAIENSLAAAEHGGRDTHLDTVQPRRRTRSHPLRRRRRSGSARARAMVLVELALPGAVFVYNGAELGLPNVDLPDEALQDPVWERSGHTERGRDGCRVPMPWEGDAPPFGFSANPDTWLPIPPEWAALTVEAQLARPDSTLSFYRRAIELRREPNRIRRHGRRVARRARRRSGVPAAPAD